jgi:Tol biopolymer transport system component
MKQFIVSFLCIGALILSSACTIQTSQGTSSNQNPEQAADETSQIPVTWTDLHLTGRLIYVVADFAGGSSKGGLRVALRSLDLATGKVEKIFETETGGWIRSLAVSPDNKNLVIGYAPPADRSSPTEELYLLSVDGSQPPQLVFTPPTDDDQYDQPDWSPDGKYLYFTHFNLQSTTSGYDIMRLVYPDGKPELLVSNAYWPRVSTDGSQIAYVAISSVFSANGPNQLFLANADGTNPHPVPLSGSEWTHNIIDAPLFLPDGKNILFSAPVQKQSSAPSWVDKITGVTVAHAHGTIPSDWWSVPLAGGKPVRLTHLYAPGLFADLSPDSKFIASYSSSGIVVMDLQGGSLTQIVSYTGGIVGTLRWIP